mgnify:CR=1 FL=1
MFAIEQNFKKLIVFKLIFWLFLLTLLFTFLPFHLSTFSPHQFEFSEVNQTVNVFNSKFWSFLWVGWFKVLTLRKVQCKFTRLSISIILDFFREFWIISPEDVLEFEQMSSEDSKKHFQNIETGHPNKGTEWWVYLLRL